MQLGATAADEAAGFNRNTAYSRIGRGTSDSFTISGSEMYCSIRSEFSDLQLTVNRSPAIVVPSPSRQRPLELVGVLNLCN